MRRFNRSASSTSRQVHKTTIGRRSTSISTSADFGPIQSTQKFDLLQIQQRDKTVPARNASLLKDLTSTQRSQYDVLVGEEWLPKQPDDLAGGAWVDDPAPDSDRLSMSDVLSTDICTGRSRMPPQRSWGERLGREASNWDAQMPRLVEVFRRWKYDVPTTNAADAAKVGAVDPTPTYNVLCIDLYSQSHREFVGAPGEQYANETLLRHGYISPTPAVPSLAISINCLELYRVARSRCATFSIDAFVKTLCELQTMPFRSFFRRQFSRAFVAYDDILGGVRRRLFRVLGRHDMNWRSKNHCPACSYELLDEPELSPRKMFSMDGNNSLKRVLRKSSEEPGRFQGTYFLSPSIVDLYKDEVKQRRAAEPEPEPADDDPDNAEHEQLDGFHSSVEPGPTDTEGVTSSCASNWRAAEAQTSKKIPKFFHETGIFLACCRHGLVSVVADMVQSGELAKYPLAILNRLIEDHGNSISVAYDIGCSFDATVRSSPLLKDKYITSKAQLIVPAFHAYAHNRSCQLSWHPLWRSGHGIEDYEGCERVFSSSNAVARSTRHAGSMLRHRMIELHFQRWDSDRYSSLGEFLYKNYDQSLSMTQEYSSVLSKLPVESNVLDTEVEDLLGCERNHLASLRTEPKIDTLRVEYVSQLDKLRIAQEKFDAAWGMSHSDQAPTQRITVAQQQKRNSSQQRLNIALAAVERLEADLGIQKRWTSETTEYQVTEKYIVERRLHAAVDRLELLVVQRLLELARLNVAGLGYKLRRHIAKALRTRSRAITTAIKRYNTIASQLSPPQPPLDHNAILRHAFLGELDFLRLCRTDVRTERWAQPAVREASEARLRLRRAKEERVRVQVEARRLLTYMDNEEAQLLSLAKSLRNSGSDPLSASEIEAYHAIRCTQNHSNRLWLSKLFQLPDFDGNPHAGSARGQYPVPMACPPQQLATASHTGVKPISEDEDTDDDVDDEHDDANQALTNFMSLSTE